MAGEGSVAGRLVCCVTATERVLLDVFESARGAGVFREHPLAGRVSQIYDAVQYIGGQPFTLAFAPGAPCKLHTPDLVLLGDGLPPLVVDVKNPEQAATQKWQERAAVIRDVLAEAGIGYETWTGMPRLMQANLENFTEARVPEASYRRWAPVGQELCSKPMPVVELVARVAAQGYERGYALMLIRRMLWCGDLRTDMRLLFRSTSIVWTVNP